MKRFGSSKGRDKTPSFSGAPVRPLDVEISNMTVKQRAELVAGQYPTTVQTQKEKSPSKVLVSPRPGYVRFLENGPRIQRAVSKFVKTPNLVRASITKPLFTSANGEQPKKNTSIKGTGINVSVQVVLPKKTASIGTQSNLELLNKTGPTTKNVSTITSTIGTQKSKGSKTRGRIAQGPESRKVARSPRVRRSPKDKNGAASPVNSASLDKLAAAAESLAVAATALQTKIAESTPSTANPTTTVEKEPQKVIVEVLHRHQLGIDARKTPTASAMATASAAAMASATASANVSKILDPDIAKNKAEIAENKAAISKLELQIAELNKKGPALNPAEKTKLESLEAQKIQIQVDINLKLENIAKQTQTQANISKQTPENIAKQKQANFQKKKQKISNLEERLETLKISSEPNKVKLAGQIAKTKADLEKAKIAISRNKNATKRKINARQAPNITKKNSNNIFNFDKLGTFIVPKTTNNAVTNAVTLPVTNPVANAISKNLTELVTVGTNVQKSIKTSVDEQIALKPRKPTKLETNSEFIEKDIDNLKPTNKGWLWGKISQIWRSPRQRLFNEYVSQHKSNDPTGEQYKQGLRAYLKKKVLETSVAADKKYKENLTYKTAIEDIMEKNQSAKIDKSKALASAISELMDERGETPETLTKKEAKQIRKEGKKIVKDSGKASRKAWKAQKTIINSDYMSTIREGQGILNKLRIRTNQGTKYNRKVRKILGIPNNSPIVPLKPNGPAPVTGPAPAPVFVSRKQAEFNQMKRNNKIQKAAVAEVAAKAEVEAVEAQIASEKLPGFEGPQRNPLYTPIPEPISETVDPRKPLKQINLPATGTDKQTKKGKRTALVNNPNLTTQGVNNKKLTSEQMVLTNAQRAKMTMTNKYTYTDADKLNLSPEKLIQVEAAEKKAKETAAAKAKYTEELLARPEFANTEVQAKIQTNSNTSKLSNAEFRTQIKADKATLKQYKKQKQLKKKNLQIVLKKIFQKTINNSQLLKAHKDEQAAAKSDAKKKRRITAKAAKAAKYSQSASFTPTRRNTLFKNPNKDYIQVDA